MVSTGRNNGGAASVEHVALATLVALLFAAALAILAGSPPPEEGRRLGAAIARRIACAPRLPDPCRRDPLVEAYGRPLAHLIRALAPPAAAVPGPGGAPLLPVDFRHCRRPSCAVPAAGPAGRRLSTANRRATAFVEVRDRRRAGGGGVEVIYRLYRPGLGWSSLARGVAAVPPPPPGRRPWPANGGDLRLVPLEGSVGTAAGRLGLGLGMARRLGLGLGMARRLGPGPGAALGH